MPSHTSDEAVKKATGKDWKGWVVILSETKDRHAHSSLKEQSIAVRFLASSE